MSPVRKQRWEPPRIDRVAVVDVHVPADRRPVSEAAVVALMESIRTLGLRTPIAVREVNEMELPGDGLVCNVPVLVAGAHRLEACHRLGHELIACIFMDRGDETTARKWEIAENLHRSELTEAERRQHIAEWVRLTTDEVLHGATPLPGGRQPAEQAIRKAARMLNLSPATVSRAVAAESLSPEVKAAADAAGLGTVKRARVAREATPAEQLAAVEQEMTARERQLPGEPTPVPDFSAATDAAVLLLETLSDQALSKVRDALSRVSWAEVSRELDRLLAQEAGR